MEGGGKVECVLSYVKYRDFRSCLYFVMSPVCSCLDGMFLPHGTMDVNYP